MGVLVAVRNTVVSIVIILAVLVGGMVAYTYFLGPENEGNAAKQAEQAAVPVQTEVTPTKPSANTPASASVTALSSPVVPGDNASLTIKTVPTAKCTVAVTYGTVAAKDSGLAPKNADEFGTVSWVWTVDKAAPIGTWPVKVTCAYGAKSAMVQGDLVVSKTTEPDLEPAR